MNLRKQYKVLDPVLRRISDEELESLCERIGSFEIIPGAFVQDPVTNLNHDGLMFSKIHLAIRELLQQRRNA
jgi:hypothetical protein